MAYNLKIDGVAMPEPMRDGVQYKRSKVWSENTRRTSSATMSGTIVDEKVSLSISFPPNLTSEEVDKILTATTCKGGSKKNKKEWHSMTFTNERGKNEDIKVYFGDSEMNCLSFIKGKMMFSSVKIEAVEK